MKPKIDFPTFWERHGVWEVPEHLTLRLFAQRLWNVSQSVANGWDLTNSCSACEKSDSPRWKGGLCQRCYQRIRLRENKK